MIIRMVVELNCDPELDIEGDPEGVLDLEAYLSEASDLLLHSNDEFGDTLGNIKVLSIEGDDSLGPLPRGGGG